MENYFKHLSPNLQTSNRPLPPLSKSHESSNSNTLKNELLYYIMIIIMIILFRLPF